MRKRFIKRKKIKNFKIIIYMLLIFCFYIILSSFFNNFKLATSNEEFLSYLLKDEDYYLLYEDNQIKLLNRFVYSITKIKLENPLTILENTYHYHLDEEKQTASDSDNILPTSSTYIEDPNPKETNNPIIYLYNTHQLEEYNSNNYEDYNITPNVMMASYILKEKLNNMNLPTIVETSDISDFLNSNGWNYASSYKASRYYLEDAFKKNPDLKLAIDIHRDSIGKTSSTVNIDNKNYAKVLFVVGLDHNNYQANLNITNKINDLIKKDYPNLSRGVLTKSGKNVNGIYNQDLSEKIILIECGGYENTIDEVMNTMEILSKVIKKYLEE